MLKFSFSQLKCFSQNYLEVDIKKRGCVFFGGRESVGRGVSEHVSFVRTGNEAFILKYPSSRDVSEQISQHLLVSAEAPVGCFI